MVQWLRFHLPVQGVWVWSLVSDLSFHMLWGSIKIFFKRKRKQLDGFQWYWRVCLGQPSLKCRFLEKHKMHFKSEGLKKKKKKYSFPLVVLKLD